MKTTTLTKPIGFENEVKKAIQFSKNHYENFPVLSLFFSKEQNNSIALIYKFARLSDDIADSKDSPIYNKIVQLDLFRMQLENDVPNEMQEFFRSLKYVFAKNNLNIENLFNLLKAFKFDAEMKEFEKYDDILNYTKNSANPIGKLILEIHGIQNQEIHQLADKITTALQLTNFLQDIKSDYERNRIYFANENLKQYDLEKDKLLEEQNHPKLAEIVNKYSEKIEEFYREGSRITKYLPLKLRVQIKLTILGGWRILKKIKQSSIKNLLENPPKLNNFDRIKILLEVMLEISKNKNRESNFYYTFKFLPKEKSKDIEDFYTFARMSDEIVDKTLTNLPKDITLVNWQNELELGFNGKSTIELMNRIGKIREKYDINGLYFFELLRGLERDILQDRIKDFAELESYAYDVASTVGLISLKIFGYTSPIAPSFAINLGKALQIINIIRDVREDYLMRRIYIPLTFLEEFGVKESELMEKRVRPQMKEMLSILGKKAEDFYYKAFDSLYEKDKKTLFPAVAMGKIYFELYKKMKEDNFNVIENRYSLTKNEKLKIVFWEIVKGKLGLWKLQ